MIDPKGLGREHVGKVVRYTSKGGDTTETGFLSGWNEQYIFVRYKGSNRGTATQPEDLEWVTGMRVAFRGYGDGKLLFEEVNTYEQEFDGLDQHMPELVHRHMEKLQGCRRHVIEIEFLDEPNPNARFYRFGTDPSGMVTPIQFEFPIPPTVQ